ncbi:uroporphyrinogen-III synthase [Aliiglaciecola litoralis]|uniref:Uroporphyrinogen-III synthase n=1 Tax=Aliiglaciecola litoralis TaxID=582857 RepID=A0ABP3WT07_9ALTE
MSVLLLRPKEKLIASTEFLKQHGISAVGVGLIEIEPNIEDLAAFKRELTQLPTDPKHRYCAIFVSTHAADIVVKSAITWPASVKLYAVGPSTAVNLNELGEKVTVPDIANSEGLLELPELQDMQNSTVFLVKGEGGRPLLPTELTARGAKVKEVNLYRRHRCEPPIETQAWQRSQIQCIVATSGEIMQVAWETFDKSWLKTQTWIVVSRRLVEFAAKLGIQKVIQSEGASDTQLKDSINHFLER